MAKERVPSSELRKFVAPEIVFGSGSRSLAGAYVKNLGGSRVLLVTDPGVRQTGWAEQVEAALLAQGLEVFLFEELSSDPRAHEVAAGVERYLAHRCNALAVVGGGSPIDCAKGIAISAAHQRDILAFEGVDRVERAIPPLVCVPTTAGTSADVSQFAVITDPGRRTKIAIISKAIVPDVSLIDPETLVTMSRDLSINTGFDALTHAIEAFVSTGRSALTDMLALEGVRLVTRHLKASLREPENVQRRVPVMQGSLVAGLAFSNASLGIVHAMAHSVGGWTGAPHGECNAILLPVGVAFNFEAAPERFRAIAEAMDVAAPGMPLPEVKAALVERLREMRRELGATSTLADVGVARQDLATLAAMALHDPNIATNPRHPTPEEVEELYAQAL